MQNLAKSSMIKIISPLIINWLTVNDKNVEDNPEMKKVVEGFDQDQMDKMK